MIDETIFYNNLLTKKLGHNAELFEKTEISTNEIVKSRICSDKLITAITLNQKNGRGRIGRNWHSEENKSLAMSFAVDAKLSLENMKSITLIAALSVVDAIISPKIKPLIKWPNDILLEGKKVAGILTEVKNYRDNNYIIIGIGVNISNTSFPMQINDTATSLYMQGENACPEKIAARILNAFEKRYNTYINNGGFETQKDEYIRYMAGVNKEAAILDSSVSNGDIKGAKIIATGKLIGVNKYGNLIIESDNRKQIFESGELSLRIKSN